MVALKKKKNNKHNGRADCDLNMHSEFTFYHFHSRKGHAEKRMSAKLCFIPPCELVKRKIPINLL